VIKKTCVYDLDNTLMIFTNEFRVTKDEYIDALIALMKSESRAADLYLEILRFQYKQESMKTTAGRVAKHIGHKSANGTYGRLAKFIGKELGLEAALPKRLDGSIQWYRVISRGRAGSYDTIDNHFEYQLIPELAEALEDLKLVERAQ